MEQVRIAAIGLALAAVAGCGGTGGGDNGGGDFVLPLEYQPFFDDSTVQSLLNQRSSLVALDRTPSGSILPTGTANYSGVAEFNLDVNADGATDHRMVANINLQAELLFAGDDITGSVSNIHTRSGNVATENIGGSLTVTGELDDGDKTIQGTIAGTLDGYLGGEELQEFSLVGSFSGEVRQQPEVRTSPFFPAGTDRAAALTANAMGQLGDDLDGGMFFGGFAAER